MALYEPGKEPDKIKGRIETLFQKLDGAYPDKVIVGLHNRHKKWGETVTDLYRKLGYSSGQEFLEAYGYQYAHAENKGGRPSSFDANEVVEKLKERYPNGSEFYTVDSLFMNNEDILPCKKTLANVSSKVFGMPLTKYLKSIGILKENSERLEQYSHVENKSGRTNTFDANEVIEKLKERYPNGSEFHTMDSLFIANKDIFPYRQRLANVSSKVFGMPLTKYLKSIGILKENNKKLEQLKEGSTIKKQNDMIDLQSRGVELSEDGTIVEKFDAVKNGTGGVIKIPSGVINIEDTVFLGKTIKKLYINKELNSIGKYTLKKQDGEYKKIGFIQVEEGNEQYFSDEVGLYSILKGGKKKRLEYIFKHDITSYETPDNVIEFAPNAFQYCFNLQNIILGENFKNWDERALPDVDRIKSIYIPKNVGRIQRKYIDYQIDNLLQYDIDEENEHFFRDEDSIYEVLENGTYKLIQCMYMGKGRIVVLDGTSIIGKDAFLDCKGFTQIELPNTIEIIEKGAFSYTALKDISIPGNIKRIEKRAFYFCEDLDSIKIPSTIEYLAVDALEGCNKLRKIESDKKNEFILNQKGIIKRLNQDGQRDFTYIKDKEGIHIKQWIGEEYVKEMTFPSEIEGAQVTEIGSNIWNWRNREMLEQIEIVTIPEGIKQIGASVLFEMSHLKKVIFPNSVESISPNLFADRDGNYKDMYLNEDTVFIAPHNSYAEKFLKSYRPKGDISNLMVVPDESQESRQKLQSLQLFKLSGSSMVGEVEFKYIQQDEKEEIQTAIVPSVVNNTMVNILDIRRIPKFIKKIIIPAQIRKITNTEIALNDYERGYKIERIEIAEENPNYYSDGYAIYTKNKEELIRFLDYTAEEYKICEETKRIRAGAFKQMIHLKALTLSKMIEYIGDYAFEKCEQLEKIIGIENVQKIGEGVVNRTAFEANQDVLVIAKVLIKYKYNQETRIVVPNGVKSIKEGVFRGCYALEELEIPASVENIALEALPKNYFAEREYRGKMEKMNFRKITVSTENQNYCSVDGILFSKDKTILYYAPPYIEYQKYIIPPEVKVISKEAFYGNMTLNEVIFSEGNIIIQDSAFCCCRKLKKVKLSKSIEEIGEQAFNECELLAKVVWSSNLKTIGDGAFRWTKLTEINLPDTLEYVGTAAFELTRCEHVVLPKSVKKIGYGVFGWCKEIEIYDSIADTEIDCKNGIDLLNGYPNSLVGYIGIGKAWELRNEKCAVCNYRWYGYTIVVRSSVDDKIKYKVWMGTGNSQSQYESFLASAWGKNATFDFEFLDDFFSKIKGVDTKTLVAQYRLEYPVELSQENKKKYEDYLSRNRREE